MAKTAALDRYMAGENLGSRQALEALDEAKTTIESLQKSKSNMSKKLKEAGEQMARAGWLTLSEVEGLLSFGAFEAADAYLARDGKELSLWGYDVRPLLGGFTWAAGAAMEITGSQWGQHVRALGRGPLFSYIGRAIRGAMAAPSGVGSAPRAPTSIGNAWVGPDQPATSTIFGG